MNTFSLQFENVSPIFRLFDNLVTGDTPNDHVQQAAEEISNNDPKGPGDMSKAIGELENDAVEKKAEEEEASSDEADNASESTGGEPSAGMDSAV